MESRWKSIAESLLWLWANEEVIYFALAAATVTGGAIVLVAEALGAPQWAAYASIGAVPLVSWAAVSINNRGSQPTSIGLSNDKSKR